MDLGFLIVLSLALGLGAWLFFLWSVKSGQYDDPEGPKYRMLDDDPDEAPRSAAPPSKPAAIQGTLVPTSRQRGYGARPMPTPPAAPLGRAFGLLLFLLPSFIWGTTWLVIKFQLGAVDPAASVAWRFALAAVLLLGWCALRGIPLRFRAGDHLRLALLGLLLFGLNYVLVYLAEGTLTSGLVAVLFAFLVFWNLLGARVFFGTPAPRAVVAGALLGVVGVGLLFWPEVTSLRAGAGQGLGVLYAVLGTVVASGGNLWSQRLFARRIGVVPGTAWAMGYASLEVLAWCVLRGVPLTFDPRPPYVLSLLYLALLGSVVAFVSYLTLLQRIGAGRAGYTAAVIPVVAMLASTLFEAYRWSGPAVAGLGLVLAGTVLVLRAKERAARAGASSRN